MVSHTVTIYDLYQDRWNTKKLKLRPEGHHRAVEMNETLEKQQANLEKQTNQKRS